MLPLHHTFEFTAGLLMPLMRGAQPGLHSGVGKPGRGGPGPRIAVFGPAGTVLAEHPVPA